MINKNFLSAQMKSSTLKRNRFSGMVGTSFLLLLVALTSWQCRDDDFTGEVIGVCPEVITTSPAYGAVNVVSDKLITATFNEAMDPASINENTFFLTRAGVRVAGIVTYSGTTATFSPAGLLHPNTVYTATVKRESKNLMGSYMVKDTTWMFNTGSAPAVILTDPAEGASDVMLNKAVTAVFSTAMNPATINAASFKLMQGATPVAGAVSYAGTTATFTPAAAFLPNTVYSATIATLAKDMAGNAMIKDTTWSFATGVLPLITITNPINGSVNVSIDAIVSATFSKKMNPLTISPLTFMLKRGTTAVAGAVSYKDMTATFTPAAPLLNGVEYTATISAGVKDVSGKSIPSDSTWKFSTAVVIPPVLPVVLSTDPDDAADNVALNKVIRATFSKTMDNTTLNSATFKVMHGIMPVVGIITYAGNIGSFTPVSPLLNGTTYDVTITTGAKDMDGNALASDKNWSFKTQNAVISGPMGIDLGSAANFAVLAGSGVTNTGVTTQITGDVGAFPTATINGLLAGNVIGTLFVVADPIVGLAKTDLTTAYNDAQGRSVNAISLPGQLGGLTLAPGLYVNSSTSGISGTGANGILTLDAGGNPNAVWIFRMGSTLITDAGTSIVLAGGAQAKNIYWSVGTSATLGTNSAFFGNILADQSITLTTGATLIGRALTRIGAVTLDTNTVIKP